MRLLCVVVAAAFNGAAVCVDVCVSFVLCLRRFVLLSASLS